ncbi:MAG: hypothetical protein SOX72_06655, partial [Oscillospiraceae bacterium]|nr:hypothetical protein [Oscillospiraceae bacterium]
MLRHFQKARCGPEAHDTSGPLPAFSAPVFRFSPQSLLPGKPYAVLRFLISPFSLFCVLSFLAGKPKNILFFISGFTDIIYLLASFLQKGRPFPGEG